MPKLERYRAEIITSDGTLKTGRYQSVSLFGGRYAVNEAYHLGVRETQVLVLGMLGMPVKETADIFGTSPTTVQNQRSNCYEALGAHSIAHAGMRGFDADIGLFLAVEPAAIPDSAEVELDLIEPYSHGKTFRDIATDMTDEAGRIIAVKQVQQLSDIVRRSFGVPSLDTVVTVCRLAGVLPLEADDAQVPQ